MAKNIGYGMIPIALIMTPLAAFGLTYDDVGDFFRNAVNGATENRPPTVQLPTIDPNTSRQIQAIPYSSFGDISDREIQDLNYLKFPQSSRAMRRRFGAPSYLRGNEEWFTRSNGGFVVIQYEGNQAIGMRYENQ
jgi:hypothetical protein